MYNKKKSPTKIIFLVALCAALCYWIYIKFIKKPVVVTVPKPKLVGKVVVDDVIKAGDNGGTFWDLNNTSDVIDEINIPRIFNPMDGNTPIVYGDGITQMSMDKMKKLYQASLNNTTLTPAFD